MAPGSQYYKEFQPVDVTVAEVDELLRSVLEQSKKGDAVPSGHTAPQLAQILGISELRVNQMLEEIRTRKIQRTGIGREKRIMMLSAFATVVIAVLLLGSYRVGHRNGVLQGHERWAQDMTGANNDPLTFENEPTLLKGEFRVFLPNGQTVIPVPKNAPSLSMLTKLDEAINPSTFPVLGTTYDNEIRSQITNGNFNVRGVVIASVGYSFTRSNGMQSYREFELPYYWGPDNQISTLVHRQRERIIVHLFK